ncbi:MAG TPA: sugar phosphate isomerase/epimerase family protein [Herpetosiphonaceae bacterium]
MQVGMMNDPAVDPVTEARWAARNGFEFLDLTMEGPAAAVEQVKVTALKNVLDQTGLGIVGHTAWYLPFASPAPEVRAGAVASVKATFESFKQLGTTYVNVHVDRGISAFSYDDTLRWNAESFGQLAEEAQAYGLTIMIENVVNNLNNAKAFRTLLDAHPNLRFHLDIAHANVKGDRTAEFLKSHAAKLVHVHISDNKRTSDDHLPMGVGAIDWPEQLGLLQASGYDGTITLEVFTPDRGYLVENAARLRKLWQKLKEQA